jgi:hypothetical protein
MLSKKLPFSVIGLKLCRAPLVGALPPNASATSAPTLVVRCHFDDVFLPYIPGDHKGRPYGRLPFSYPFDMPQTSHATPSKRLRKGYKRHRKKSFGSQKAFIFVHRMNGAMGLFFL